MGRLGNIDASTPQNNILTRKKTRKYPLNEGWYIKKRSQYPLKDKLPIKNIASRTQTMRWLEKV